MRLDTNPFLASVMRVVRSQRPMLRVDQPFFNRVEKVPAGDYVEVWFRTGGCTWDRVGGCTMCNYGFGTDISTSTAVDVVRAALEALPGRPDELMVSPSGGMWDPKEVPTDALGPIYELAVAARPKRFFVETRAETVSTERIREIKAALPSTELAVELGLESFHDAVLAFCVNKGSSSQTFETAASELTANGINVYANVSLGTAFLDRATAVRDAVATVRWALRHGATNAVVFPLHVKPFTLLELLHEHGRYRAVSLWDLVEVLHTLGPDVSSHVEIAWYKSYYDTAEKVTLSPVGCATCTSWLVDGLDRYRATQKFDVIDELDRARCGCAPERVAEMDPSLPDDQLAAAVLDEYEWLAGALKLERSWARFAPRLRPAVQRAFQGYRSACAAEDSRSVA